MCDKIKGDSERGREGEGEKEREKERKRDGGIIIMRMNCNGK